jgi:hypothetical protein
MSPQSKKKMYVFHISDEEAQICWQNGMALIVNFVAARTLN